MCGCTSQTARCKNAKWLPANSPVTAEFVLKAGYRFEKVFFQPDLVKISIDGFMWNLVMSVVIVIIVLMVSMGFRSGFIIGTGLVLTILAAFPILLAAGGTLQRISLGAFIVAMTQVPLFAEKLLKRKKKKDNEELYHGWAYRKFRNMLGLLLHYKTVTLIVTILLLALAAFNFQEQSIRRLLYH